MLHDGLLGRRLIFDSGGSPPVAPTLVQSAVENNTGAFTSHTDLPGAVVAGHLLMLAGSKTSHGAIGFDSSSIFVSGTGLANPRPFTKFATDVFSATDPPPYNPVVIGWRIATGDEQHLDLFSGNKFAIYEYLGFGDPTTFEVRWLTLQAASSAKSLGAFLDAGGAQVFAANWGDSTTTIATDQVLGAGYTQDIQAGTGVSGLGNPGFIAGHGAAGGTPQITSGQSAPWAAMAVGIKGLSL